MKIYSPIGILGWRRCLYYSIRVIVCVTRFRGFAARFSLLDRLERRATQAKRVKDSSVNNVFHLTVESGPRAVVVVAFAWILTSRME